MCYRRVPRRVSINTERCVPIKRHDEKERNIAFLLKEDEMAAHVGILPIIGPRGTGKSTLIHDASRDARVRAHFTVIEHFGLYNVLLHLHTAGAAVAATMDTSSRSMEDHRIRHYLDVVRNIAQQERFARNRSLLMAHWSKVVITSKHDRIAGFDVMEEAIRTKNKMSKEECWYHFKAFALCGEADDLAIADRGRPERVVPTHKRFWCVILQRLVDHMINADMDYVQEFVWIGQITVKLVLPMHLMLQGCSITKQEGFDSQFGPELSHMAGEIAYSCRGDDSGYVDVIPCRSHTPSFEIYNHS
uniref:NB-ARC domain-containing protein n=1 Tax=Oryza barthii TaxID=65489 RepID=A0A0D3F7J0_9ORYZ